MLRSCFHSATLALVLTTTATPVVAQKYRYDDIPWGITEARLRDILNKRGYTYRKAPDSDRFAYFSPEGHKLTPDFAGGALVALGVRVQTDSIFNTFRRLRTEYTASLGVPDSLKENGQGKAYTEADTMRLYGEVGPSMTVLWRDKETRVYVFLGRKPAESNPFVHVFASGPGYSEDGLMLKTLVETETKAVLERLPKLEAGRWTVLEQNLGGRAALDRKTLVTLRPGVFRVWQRQDMGRPASDGAMHILYRVDYDCNRMRYRAVQLAAYDEDGIEVDFRQYSPTESTWISVTKEPMFERLSAKACKVLLAKR